MQKASAAMRQEVLQNMVLQFKKAELKDAADSVLRAALACGKISDHQIRSSFGVGHQRLVECVSITLNYNEWANNIQNPKYSFCMSLSRVSNRRLVLHVHTSGNVNMFWKGDLLINERRMLPRQRQMTCGHSISTAST